MSETTSVRKATDQTSEWTLVPRSLTDAIAYYETEDDPLRSGRSMEYLTEEEVEEYERTRDPELLKDLVGRTAWYHTIDLGRGLCTPGLFDHRDLVAEYGFPDSLEGQSVLDVATHDGFWAFELERRGGSVTAIDLPNRLGRDWPPQVLKALDERGLDGRLDLPSRLAKAALASKVDFRGLSVYQLDELGMEFDFVHMGDLLLHLENPVAALRRLREVTRGVAHIVECYSPNLDPHSLAFEYVGGWDWVTWWLPSLSALGQLCVDVGFTDVKLLGTYRSSPSPEVAGLPRAIIRAS